MRLSVVIIDVLAIFVLICFVCISSFSFRKCVGWNRSIGYKNSKCIIVSNWKLNNLATRVASFQAESTKNTSVASNTVKLNIQHVNQVVTLTSQHFMPECDQLIDKINLIWSILYLFIPKLLFPAFMGHSLIGVLSDTYGNDLIGMIDVSLQPNSGNLDVLQHKPLFSRKSSLKPGLKLTPYICNLLVSEKYRKKGYGRVLVRAAASQALEWGHREVCLHVEAKSLPALCLYISEGFDIVTKSDTLIYMNKKL